MLKDLEDRYTFIRGVTLKLPDFETVETDMSLRWSYRPVSKAFENLYISF